MNIWTVSVKRLDCYCNCISLLQNTKKDEMCVCAWYKGSLSHQNKEFNIQYFQLLFLPTPRRIGKLHIWDLHQF